MLNLRLSVIGLLGMMALIAHATPAQAQQLSMTINTPSQGDDRGENVNIGVTGVTVPAGQAVSLEAWELDASGNEIGTIALQTAATVSDGGTGEWGDTLDCPPDRWPVGTLKVRIRASFIGGPFNEEIKDTVDIDIIDQ